jgi:CubicO group peptidase (beta-lactamase class C family)
MTDRITHWIKRLSIGLIVLTGLLVVGLFATGNGHIFAGFSKTYLIGKPNPDIDDKALFDVSIIPSDLANPWPLSPALNQLAPSADQLLLMDTMQTTAFLVFHRDTLVFEQYWMDGGREVVSNSFSMAKSFTSMLIGKAIDEGFIKNVDQPVGDFLPEFKTGSNAALTIRHLLTMTSGIPFGEAYFNPFGYMAKAYYGSDLISATEGYAVEKTPGTFWVYEGGNTVLLGLIVKEATGRQPSEYFFQKFWSCVGAEYPAYWNLDRAGGMEKTFSGFYATARDYGRIGKLMMNQGVWDKDTLLSPQWVADSFTSCMVPDHRNQPASWYGLQWWIGQYQNEPFYSARGLRGQYIIMMPKQDLVVVRLGHKQSKERVENMPPDIFVYMDAAKAVAGI